MHRDDLDWSLFLLGSVRKWRPTFPCVLPVVWSESFGCARSVLFCILGFRVKRLVAQARPRRVPGFRNRMEVGHDFLFRLAWLNIDGFLTDTHGPKKRGAMSFCSKDGQAP